MDDDAPWTKETLSEIIERLYSLLLGNESAAKIVLDSMSRRIYDAQRGASLNPGDVSIVREIADELKYKGWLPVYSMRVACGPLPDGDEVSEDGPSRRSATRLVLLVPRKSTTKRSSAADVAPRVQCSVCAKPTDCWEGSTGGANKLCVVCLLGVGVLINGLAVNTPVTTSTI